MENICFLSITVEELKGIIQQTVHEELNKKAGKTIMNSREVCEFLNISSSTLNKWKAENKIPYKRLGKRIFFNKQEVLAALKDSNYYKLKDLKC